MKKFNKPFIYSLVLLAALTLPGCELIAGIFEAGVWVGILISIVVLVVIIILIIKMLKAFKK